MLKGSGSKGQSKKSSASNIDGNEVSVGGRGGKKLNRKRSKNGKAKAKAKVTGKGKGKQKEKQSDQDEGMRSWYLAFSY